MIEKLEKIISTTKIGETVVLIETEKNEYVRTKSGLRKISTETLKREQVTNSPHHQYGDGSSQQEVKHG